MTPLLRRLGIAEPRAGSGALIESLNPTTGAVIGAARGLSRAEYDQVVDGAERRFAEWRTRPAPRRAALVRRMAELLRAHKEPLGELVSVEVGKIRSEGLGEVQEMIDVCDLAIGLSRTLHGLTLPSERPRHRIVESWHPLGTVGVITAFNFPVAVWAWNAMIAAVCGDTCVWKPSPRTPLCSLAVQALAEQAMAAEDAAGVWSLTVGGTEVGEWLADDERVPLVSFTGSIAAGRKVATRVATRLGRSLLELGGNNGAIVLDDADLDLAVRALTFSAVGTAGQRCTSTRRLFAQRGIAPRLAERLVAAYRSVRVGDPLEAGVLMGPLVDGAAVERFRAALATARAQGGEVLFGGNALVGPGFFVEPTLVKAPSHERFPIAWDETFAPILYLFEVDDLPQAIAANNAVKQGLSSALFTESMRATERFLSAEGSDCGLANVNTGTSGAEIGGAFGGEKETGGGRESGSDSWKTYMRRQTATINFGDELPLAQGVEFL